MIPPFPKRLLGLCLVPVFLASLDGALTLSGQSAEYWAGNYGIHCMQLLEVKMKSLIFAFCVVFACGDLRAQTNVWQPSVGHVQIPIWPGAAPDAEAVPGPENYTTTTKLIAGRPAVVVNNVSRKTETATY